MEKDKKDEPFKVVDRRFSSRDESEEKKTDTSSKAKQPASGEGFTMREGKGFEEQGTEEIDFSTFVMSLATSAIISLGLAPDPITKKVKTDLQVARQNIDILVMLKGKTKGNLTPDEAGLIESLVTETQLRFVEAIKKK